MMEVLVAAICFTPLAASGWLTGLRGGRWIFIGLAMCLLTLMSGLVLVDNAGDPPDAYPSTVFMIVVGVFVLFALAGVFTREYRVNKSGEVVR